MGHMFETSQVDITMRWERMRGKNVLWLPGCDHAGIATQMLVERSLKEQGVDRREIGREKFLEPRLGLEGEVRRHDLWPTQARRRQLRLEP